MDQPGTGYRQTTGRWRHFERLPMWPSGYAALGDTVCTFNPIYGQGMTAALMGVAALRELLGERGVAPDLGAHLRWRVARLRAALRRPEVHHRWMRVVNLLDDPATLLPPGILGPALASLRCRP